MKKYYIIFALLLAGLFSFASIKLSMPILVSPANAVAGQMPNVLLDWNPVSGTIGLHYEIQVDTSVTFLNPTLLQTELSSINNSELLFGKKYFWRVRAVDNSGASEWTVTRSFDVVITVSLYKPDNNAMDQMPNVEISWSSNINPSGTKAFTGVSYLDYQLDTLITFNSPLASITTISGTLAKTNLSKLYFGKKYFWRMRARNDNSTSAWSDIRSFTTTKTVILRTPNDNVTDQNPVVLLSWNKISGIDKYVVLIADNPAFNLPISIETINISVESDTLQFGITYYWKVTAKHALDEITSPVRIFSTLNTVLLTAPTNNQTSVVLTPTFKWNAIPGSGYYEMWLSSSSSFESVKKYNILNTNPANGTQTYKLPINILDSAGVYFWKVRAFVTGDSSAWSSSWSFRVATSGIEDNLVTKNGMSLYPNPAKDRISIMVHSAGSALLGLNIKDLVGKTVIVSKVQFSNGKSIEDIDVSNLPNGIYFVGIQKDSGALMTKLIIDK